MEKQRADFIMEQYLKPLYGFAVNKTGNTEQAEELASRIVLQVYSVLMKRDDIQDINSYIFRIARNVWARYCKELIVGKDSINIDDTPIGDPSSIDSEIIQSDEYGVLRREIAYLSRQRREIVTAYYYRSKKVTEIANEMQMPPGTVKWHLFECKKELKKGMEIIRSIGNLGLNPIRFNDMGHSGNPGEKGVTSDFLAKSLAQNVAYACYFKALSINEIADELGVSPVFVEDEVDTLTEYGFMDLLPSGKYRTNMVITGHSESAGSRDSELEEECADVLVDKYYSKLLDIRQDVEKLPLYYTDRDYNFLLWSLIMYATEKLYFSELEIVKYHEVAVMRPDGGYYIANASIEKNRKALNQTDRMAWKYFQGYMSREDMNIYGLKLDVHWNGEIFDWKRNVIEDYKLLYHFLNGNLPMDERNLESYETLVNKGYLIKDEAGYKANIVYVPNTKTGQALDALLPVVGDEIFDISRTLDEDAYQRSIAGQPKHIHKAIRRLSCQNSIQRIHVYVMKNMLDRGMLKLPTEEQRKQICNILFNNI